MMTLRSRTLGPITALLFIAGLGCGSGDSKSSEGAGAAGAGTGRRA